MSSGRRQVLALVPARGGSVGVPRKNLRLVRGKPLVAHTLDAALASTFVDRVHLSSDDDDILAVGRALGVEVCKRPAPLATNTATAGEVVAHFIAGLPAPVVAEDPYIVYLQPTSPLRTAAHIDGAFRQMESADASTCVSVVQLKRTPFKSFRLSENGRLQSLFEEKLSNANRQALPPVYYPNGAIYIFPISEFAAKGGFPSNGSVPFVMSERDSIDIDSEDDIAMMEKQ
jgi:CMP-N-acetylneuraminic acid synthetase